MVVHLLALGGHGAKKRPAGKDQILPPVIQALVHEEILLLRADAGPHPLHLRVSEQPQHPQGLPVEGLHGAQQRRLFVQRLPAVGAEGRGNTEGFSLEKGVGGGVPGGVASGLKGGPQAAGGEGGGVRLAPDQLLAGELRNDPPVGGRADEAVMLLRSDAGEGLEPVSKVRCPVLDGPGLHGRGHRLCHHRVQTGALVNRFSELLINLGGKRCFHHSVVKNKTSEAVKVMRHTEILPKKE